MPRSNRISRAVAAVLLLLLANSAPVRGGADPTDELAPNAAKMGTQAPDFSAEEAFGDTISLSEELKDHNVLLLFYRGVF